MSRKQRQPVVVVDPKLSSPGTLVFRYAEKPPKASQSQVRAYEEFSAGVDELGAKLAVDEASLKSYFESF